MIAGPLLKERRIRRENGMMRDVHFANTSANLTTPYNTMAPIIIIVSD